MARFRRIAIRPACLAAVLTACSASPSAAPGSDSGPPTGSSGTTAPPSADQSEEASVPPTADEMTRSVVQLLIMVDGEVRTWGSGSVISQDGLILTNAHVATPEYAVDEIVVAVTGDSDQPPERAYRAEVRAADPALDLAIVQVTEALGGGPYEAGTIPPLPIGNSSETHIGDDLLIFGYPAIGRTAI